ncbi:MAG: hypothetical protein ABIW76_05315 [Fibrobacteria bacterium]
MDSFPVCTHCGFTFGEYRARGLLGCPHCYVGFGDALLGDIAWLHQALALIDDMDADAESPFPSGIPAIGSAAIGPNSAASMTDGSDSNRSGMRVSPEPAPSDQAVDGSTSAKPDAETLARWREQIAAAVRVENYEEAARLNRLIRSFGSMGSGPGLGLV